MKTWRIAALAVLVGVPASAAEPEAPGVTWEIQKTHPFHLHLASLGIHATSVFDSNIDHDLGDVDSYGVVAGLFGRIQTHSRAPMAWLGYRGAVQAYSRSERWDRVQHDGELGTRVPLGSRWDVQAKADYGNRTSTEDRDIVNQFTAGPELRLDAGDRFGARVYGAFRTRRFTDTPAYDENIWYAGGELRLAFWNGGTWRLGYRHEDAESDTRSRSYTRERVTGAHEVELGSRNRLRLGAEHQWRTYPEDLVPVGSTEVSREDRRWILTAAWVTRLPRKQELRLAYEFEDRLSNDPGEEYTAHRVEMGMVWPLVH